MQSNKLKKNKMLIISTCILIGRIILKFKDSVYIKFNPDKPARYDVRFNGEITVHKLSVVIKLIDFPLLSVL